MDDFVAKPIRFSELLAAIQRLVPDLFLARPKGSADPEQGRTKEIGFGMEAGGTRGDFDRAALMESVGGNILVLRELVRLFMDSDAPRLTTDLREAAAKRDPRALEAAGHGLYGLLGELRASRAAEKARELGAGGHEGDMTDLDERVSLLLSEMEQLKIQLRRFVETLSIS
jgi:hypothetical protein